MKVGRKVTPGAVVEACYQKADKEDEMDEALYKKTRKSLLMGDT